MSEKKNIKAELKEMFQSGEISVEILKQPKESAGDYQHYNVAIKIDNEVICNKCEVITK